MKKQINNSSKIKYYITYLLAKRDYSEAEILDKLSRKEYYEEEAARLIIDEFKKINYINDDRCAEIVVKSMYESSYGLNKIKEKAFKRKLNIDLIIQLSQNFDFYQVCKRYAERLYMNRKYDLSDIKDLNKFKRKLLSRGFSFDEVNEALDQIKK